MTKEEQLGRLVETGVVAVIRTQDGDELVSICEALVEGYRGSRDHHDLSRSD